MTDTEKRIAEILAIYREWIKSNGNDVLFVEAYLNDKDVLSLLAELEKYKAVVERLEEWRDEDALRPKSWVTRMVKYCIKGEEVNNDNR